MESIVFFLDDRTDLKEKIISQLSLKRVTIDLGDVNTQIFSDGEVCVDYETSMRGKRVYIISSPNTSDKLIQLNMAIDAAKRASAKEIIPILPYFPYARQDKKDQPRGPIGAKVVAEMIENRGATSIITFDLHADQIQGFFNIPVTHMEGKFLFDRIVAHEYNTEYGDSLVLCSPDAGGTKRVKGVRDRIKHKYEIDLPIVMIDKTRSAANQIDEMVLIGDVKGKDVIIIDDMCDTAGTLCKAAEELIKRGALSVNSIVTHGILSGPALERIANSIDKGHMSKFICSDSLPFPDGLGRNHPLSMITYVTTANQIVNAMKAINENISVEDLKRI